VRNEVQSEIARQAGFEDDRERQEAAVIGQQMKRQAISEVAHTEQELGRTRAVARLSQFIDYFFCLIYGLISLEIVFDLLGARHNNGFRNLIDTLSAPFLAPFNHLFADPASGRFQLRLSYIAALVVYILLHLAINGLLRLVAHRKTAI